MTYLEKITVIAERADSLMLRPSLDCKLDMLAVKDVLDFDKLMNADTFTFKHDILGIAYNLNHNTYELENCFIPRCVL